MAAAASARLRRMVACIAFAVAANDVESSLSNPPSVVCAPAAAAARRRHTSTAVIRAISALLLLMFNYSVTRLSNYQVWCRVQESNPHRPLGTQDFKQSRRQLVA